MTYEDNGSGGRYRTNDFLDVAPELADRVGAGIGTPGTAVTSVIEEHQPRKATPLPTHIALLRLPGTGV